jgi:hypothetical protein
MSTQPTCMYVHTSAGSRKYPKLMQSYPYPFFVNRCATRVCRYLVYYTLTRSSPLSRLLNHLLKRCSWERRPRGFFLQRDLRSRNYLSISTSTVSTNLIDSELPKTKHETHFELALKRSTHKQRWKHRTGASKRGPNEAHTEQVWRLHDS